MYVYVTDGGDRWGDVVMLGAVVGPQDRICQLPKAKHSIFVFTTDTVMGRRRRVIVVAVVIVYDQQL